VDEGPGSAVASAETPIEEATRANVPVFTIGLGGEIDAGYLERVARTTGGTFQEAPDSGQLTALFLNVPDQLKQQYVVTYQSGLPPDGDTHRVGVSVEVDDRQASDEAELGPLPLPPTPTEPPTEVPTPTRVPTALPPTAAPAEADEGGRGGILGVPPWLFAAVTVFVALSAVTLGISIAFLRRRAAQREVCSGCGRALEPGEICPDCGPDPGRSQKT
jgi:hypothetical protein